MEGPLSGDEDRVVDLNAAKQFIATADNEVDALEFARLCLGRDHVGRIADWYAQRQNPDGGFGGLGRLGEYAASASSMFSTLRWLRQLILLGLTDSDTARRAANFIAGRQQPDGSFHEAPGLDADALPTWAAPGCPGTAQRLTACACWLLPMVDDSFEKCVEAGMGLLDQIWSAHRGFLGDSHEPYVEGVGLFTRAEGIEGRRTLACIEHLDCYWDVLPFWNFPRIVEVAMTAGLPAGDGLLVRCAAKIENTQMSDGSWVDGFSLKRSVQATVLACHALKLVGAPAPAPALEK